MRLRRFRRLFRPGALTLGVLSLFAFAQGCGSSEDEEAQASVLPPVGICDAAAADKLALDMKNADDSCALACPEPCAEADKPWVCPALAPYASLPHKCEANACGAWDGKPPAVVTGKCTATVPAGDAIAKTSQAVLPDGRRLAPAGKETVFEDELIGTFPFSALRIPGTPYVVVSDDGYDDNALRVIDTTKIGTPSADVGHAKFSAPLSLNAGLALGPDGTVYAASGAPDSVIRAFSVDKATGKLSALGKAKDIKVASAAEKDVFPFAIAVSPDGKKMVVGQVKDAELLVYSLEAATYGKRLDVLSYGGAKRESFSVVFDPSSSDVVYASVWTGDFILEANLATKVIRKIPTGKHPEEIVFLDKNYLAVANGLADDITVVDRAAASVVTHVAVETQKVLHGSGPSALAFDAQSSRLYATLSGRNAVAVFDVKPSPGAGTPPQLVHAGMIPTGWWPTDVLVAGPADPSPGALTVITGKGHGTGPIGDPLLVGQGGEIGEKMKGSIQQIDAPDAAALSGYTDAWSKSNVPQAMSGVPTVTCPDGAPYDFPVPKTNTEGASKLIDTVVFVVRENKTFDAVMGDMPGVDGDPSLVMAPGKMDVIWPNFRKAAREFAHGDNFYEDAEQSIQGHFWTAFGRSSDYLERTWLTTWGRGTRGPVPTQGVSEDTWPVEGGIFTWLSANGVAFDNMGEQLANTGLDVDYGKGGFVSTSTVAPDTKLACYMALRSRVFCNLKPFTYAWFVNDHTFGGAAGKPNPALMIAVNDEATGMLLDALSHSPKWKSTLLVVVEDDPQDGSDHVDAHRSVVLLASPWVKRGYVSHTHFDVPSLHKLFAHLYGIPYNNQTVADAALPLDLFTSTPDYTPFEYVPRKYNDLSCNAAGTKSAKVAEGWDFSEPDEQPGLGQSVYRILHGQD